MLAILRDEIVFSYLYMSLFLVYYFYLDNFNIYFTTINGTDPINIIKIIYGEAKGDSDFRNSDLVKNTDWTDI